MINDYHRHRSTLQPNEDERLNNGASHPASLFWAKTDRSDSGASDYHTLLLHLVDCALVFDKLFAAKPRSIRKRLYRIVQGLSAREAKEFLCLIAASHDIGKISPGFQSKHEPARAWLEEAGYSFKNGSEPNHSVISRDFLWRYWIDAGLDDASAELVASVTAGHHGAFFGESALGVQDDDKWEAARLDTMDRLVQIVAPTLARRFDRSDRLCDGNKKEICISLNRSDAAAFIVLSGLISVADWIASDISFFPFLSIVSDDLASYIEDRAQRAAAAVQSLHLKPPPRRACGSESETASLVGLVDGKKLNGLQRIAIQAARDASGPCLLIIEAPTGEGKTEAALLAHSVSASFSPAGIFYGLPTQATSAAMYGRVNAYLSATAGGATFESHLLYDSSFLNDEYASIRVARMPTGYVFDERASDGGAIATDWFGGRKRGLLASNAVGTIDQSLLAVLRRRHFFVRLYGLSGKTVVLDEIHAYDSYMRELIKSMLCWLASLGCTVILLSATLGSDWRKELVEAYTGGSDRPTDPEASYPAIIRAETCHEIVAYPIPLGDRGRSRTARFVVARTRDDERTAMMADEAVRLSRSRLGCVACVCNTIGQAQTLYSAIISRDPDCEVTLFHSRFTKDDRRSREERLLTLFGPSGNRPERAIVIATQVIEQSLDLDFDAMLSELAPLDLMFQRLGRVMRHRRGRFGEDEPTMRVYAPATAGERCFGSSGYVYEPIALARTLVAIEASDGTFSIPEDVPTAIDTVYGNAAATTTAEYSAYEEAWRTSAEGKAAASLFTALNATIPSVEHVAESWSRLERDGYGPDDEAAVYTRLGRLGVDVAVLYERPIRPVRPDELRRFMGRTVRLSHDELAYHLRQRLDDSPWNASGPLRYVVPIRFEQGVWSDGIWTLEYDIDLGMRFRKGGNAYES